MPPLGYTSHCEAHAPIIVSQDHGVTSPKHIANNRKKSLVYQYKIDGEVITVGPRCDYLVINDELKTAYLIELKGSDVIHAAEQLSATADVLFCCLKGYKLFFRIIANRISTHAIKSTAYKKYEMKWGKALVHKTGIYEEFIS